MAPNYFQKPENALTKAREMIKVGKHQIALETLADAMKGRKQKAWQKAYEELMMLFVELCVDLKKSVQFKEIIHQYKNMVYMVNPKTLEDVVRRYLELARSKTEAAREKSTLSVSVPDIDDLDVVQTPESLMLSAVSVEGAQDRSDRTHLTPWLKFLWESYRQCLDLLRNNAKFERLYHDVAQEAYKFCITYNRKTEFRKLCDILRNHLSKLQLQIQQNLPIPATGVNLNNPDTQALHLETRLKQLDYANELELYMEAFKAVEDIWNLVVLSKKMPKPLLMVNYYTKTALVFLKSGSQLFHAAALHKLLALNREHKRSLTQEELQQLGTRVLCATLAIPLPHVREHTDTLLESGEISSAVKQKTLAGLLGLGTPPTRQSLLRDLVRNRIPSLVHPEVGKLYQVLEVEFDPLRLAARVIPALQYLRDQPELSSYIPQIEHVLISRTLLQVAQVYQSIKLSEFERLCPYADSLQLERCLVELVHNLELPIRIDHRRQAIMFDVYTDLGISQREDSPLLGTGQVGAPDQLARQLTLFGQALAQVNEILQADEPERQRNRDWSAQAYRVSAQASHDKILNRRNIIELRKETLEKLQAMRENEEEEKRQAELKRQATQEAARLTQEAEERKRRLKEEELAQLKIKMTREKINQLKATDIGAKALESISEDQIGDLDPAELIQIQTQQVIKQQREQLDKARKKEVKGDHYIRAQHLEEIPLRLVANQEQAVAARKLHDQAEAARVAVAALEHERQLKASGRLIRMCTDVETLLGRAHQTKRVNYEEKLANWLRLYEEKRAERRVERRAAKVARVRAERDRQRVLQEEEEEAEKKKRQEERELTEKAAAAEAEAATVREKKATSGNDWARETEQENRERDLQQRPQQRATRGPTSEQPDSWRGRVSGGAMRDRDPLRGGEEQRITAAPAEASGSGSGSAWRRPAERSGGWRDREKQNEEVWHPNKPTQTSAPAAPEKSADQTTLSEPQVTEAPSGEEGNWRGRSARGTDSTVASGGGRNQAPSRGERVMTRNPATPTGPQRGETRLIDRERDGVSAWSAGRQGQDRRGENTDDTRRDRPGPGSGSSGPDRRSGMMSGGPDRDRDDSRRGPVSEDKRQGGTQSGGGRPEDGGSWRSGGGGGGFDRRSGGPGGGAAPQQQQRGGDREEGSSWRRGGPPAAPGPAVSLTEESDQQVQEEDGWTVTKTKKRTGRGLQD